MKRHAILLAVSCALHFIAIHPSCSAGDPLPHQRVLLGEDKERVTELDKQTAELIRAEKYAAAAVLARQMAEIRQRVQGADHWQAIDALTECAALERLASQPTSEQKEYGNLQSLSAEAKELSAKRRFTEAEAVLRKIMASRQRLLGAEHAHSPADCSSVT